MESLAPILWFAFLGIMFLLLIVRPQRRKIAAFAAMQAAVEVGDEILTTSGLFGTVLSIDEQSLELEVADGVVLRFARQAIGSILSEDDDEVDDTEDTEAEDAAE